MQPMLTTINTFFSEAENDIANDSDAHFFHESLRHTLISSSVAEEIGMPTKAIIDNLKGYKVEFTRPKPPYSKKEVSVELTSLTNPMVTVTSFVEETIFLKKCHLLLTKEKKACRDKYHKESEKLYFSAVKALEIKKINLSYVGQSYIHKLDVELAHKCPPCEKANPCRFFLMLVLFHAYLIYIDISGIFR